MITLGIVVLIIGLIALAIGRSIPQHVIATIGMYTAIAGAVLLGVGLILLVVRGVGVDNELDVDSMRALIGV
jgi:uncharacterized membrane protein YvlD (DUF360 family)